MTALFTRPGSKGQGGGNAGQGDLSYRVICPECQNPNPNLEEDFAAGDVICRDCGAVLMDRLIDSRSEWRTFSNDGGGDDPSRVGGPVDTLVGEIEGEMVLESTAISDVGSGMSRDLNRMQQRATYRGGERAIIQAIQTINVLSERIGLSKLISDRAKVLFKRVEEEKLVRGKTMDAVIAACLYIACRQEKVPRTFREISALTLVSKKDIGRSYKAIMSGIFPRQAVDDEEMEPEKPQTPVQPQPQAPSLPTETKNVSSLLIAPGTREKAGPVLVDAQAPEKGGPLGLVSTQDFMARFCSHLNLNMEIQRGAAALSIKAQKLSHIAGKSPITIAAACIYMMTQLYPQYRKTHKDIAYVAGVSESTVRNTYKDLYPYRYELIGNLVPRAWVDNLPL